MNNPYLFRLNWRRAGVLHDTLIAFLPDTLEPANFFTQVADAIEHGLAPDELLLIARVTERDSIVRLFKADSVLGSLKERFGKKANATLALFTADGSEPQRERLWGDDEPCDLSLSSVRRRGGTLLFNDRQGFVASTPNYHFCNPSGRHTERFARLSNILVKPSEISFLAFCLLPLVPDALPYCYIDTASLLPLVGALNDHLRVLAPARPQLIADSFASYEGLERYTFDRIADGFVLISASSSGGLGRAILRKEERFGAGRVIHVLFHDDDPAPFPVVVDLRKHADDNPDGLLASRRFHAASCELCRDGSSPIPLHGEQFDFAGPQNDPILLKKPHAPRGLADVLARYGGKKKILRVGRKGTTNPGPRLFLVSDSDLLADKEFGKRLNYAARRVVPAGLRKVVYLDDHSVPFAKRLVAESGGAISPDYIPAKDADTITGSDPVLIAALVIESGRSLQDISHDLRTNCKEAPQIFVVGLAKVTSLSRLETIKATLTQTGHAVRHDFAALDTFVLPRSDNRNAWARELDFLKDPTLTNATGAVKAWLQARRSRLESNEALMDDLFIDNDPANPIEVQPGFVFWPPDIAEGNQAEVYYAVSSVLQNLRSESGRSPEAISSNWFQQTLIAPENFARFNDAAIQASLLRAARPEELNFAAHEDRSKELVRILRRVLEASDRARGGAAIEVMLALATRRLRLHPSVLTELLSPLSNPLPPRVAFVFGWLQSNRDKLH